MRYTFTCELCGRSEVLNLPVSECESVQRCVCGGPAPRDFMADWKTVQIDTTMCKDHDKVAPEHQLCPSPTGLSKAEAARRTRAYQEHIQERRRMIEDGGNQGSFRQTHAIASEFYHGKIRETGDRDYFRDPKNLRKHKSMRVDGDS